MPTPVQRASSGGAGGGGSVPPPEPPPPQGATATMWRKRHSFCVATRLSIEKTLPAMDSFLEDSTGKSYSAPPPGARLTAVRRWVSCQSQAQDAHARGTSLN